MNTYAGPKSDSPTSSANSSKSVNLPSSAFRSMPLMENTWGNSSPSKISQSMQRSSSRSKIVPLSKRNPSSSSETVDSRPDGLSSSPPDEAAWMKKRLGQVGP